MIAVAPEFAWLDNQAFNDFSQNGEDGVLQAIFSLIGAQNEWCFECGAADGLLFSNTRRLIEEGWKAILVEGDPESFGRLALNNAGFGERVRCVPLQLDREHRIDGILHRCGVPLDLDLLVVDVDGQDYYLWNQILQYRPRVVVIEFDHNADLEFIPPLGGSGQAGEKAILRLGCGKFYRAVHRTKTNLIFVEHHLSRLLQGAENQIVS
jgi:hypothetical protein